MGLFNPRGHRVHDWHGAAAEPRLDAQCFLSTKCWRDFPHPRSSRFPRSLRVRMRRAAGLAFRTPRAAWRAFIAPAITGVLVDRTGHFGAAFALAAALQVTGFIGWVVVLPKIVPLRWAETRASALQY